MSNILFFQQRLFETDPVPAGTDATIHLHPAVRKQFAMARVELETQRYICVDGQLRKPKFKSNFK